MKSQVLRSGELQLEVFPSIGGCIGAFSTSGQDLFRKASADAISQCDPGLMGAFPMLPYCNRIENGRFWFGGRWIQLEKNFDNRTNSIHGIGWKQGWSVECASSEALTLSYEHDGRDWPWRFVSQQHFQLEHDRLIYDLSITNADRNEMPAGLGLHPFFPESKKARVTGLFDGCWNCSDRGVPSDFQVLGPREGLSGEATMSEVGLDRVYVGLRSDIEVRWDNRPYYLTLLSPKEAHAHVIYSPVGEDFFCIEPVSHLPNVINMNQTAGNMSILNPGESLSIQIVFIVVEE